MGVTAVLSVLLSKLTIFKIFRLAAKAVSNHTTQNSDENDLYTTNGTCCEIRHMWLNQLHEKCLTGVKVQTPPTSSVGELELCHNSAFPSPSFISSHILPYPPQHRAPHSLHFFQVASPPTQLMNPRRPHPKK